MRLIDADKLYDAIEKYYKSSGAQSHVMARNCLDAICKEPTVEAVPLEPLCQWLSGYAAPPNYALQEVMAGYNIQPNLPILSVNYYAEAWEYHFRELLKSGLMDTEESNAESK